MVLGKKRTISGNSINRMIHPNIATQKGKIPRKMVYMGTSLATPLKTKTLTPTGGVIRLISIVKVMMIPNQIGSNPSWITMGKTIGMANTIIESPSIKHPNTTKAPMMAEMTTWRLNPAPIIQDASEFGIWLRVIKY